MGASASAADADTTVLTFLLQGKTTAAHSAEAITKDLKPETMDVYEPLEKKKKTYRGFSFLPLLQKIFGKKISTGDTISVYCTDGYRADIPLKEFEKVNSLMAFGLADGSTFKIQDGKKNIPLAPYYLVWDHPDAGSANQSVYRWPYAVNKIDLIDSKTAYLPLELKNSSTELTLGQKKFKTHCLSCHNLNGVGGNRGPALDGLMATLETDFLVKYILDPQGMNKSSQMSGLPKDLKDREKIAAAIVKYGKSISKISH